MSIVLYGMNLSPPTRTVMIVAEILGLSIELKVIDIINQRHKEPEFSERNPLKTVPVLEDGELRIVDSHAIIIYLMSKYGNDKTAKLYPSDMKKKAIVHERLFFDATILFPRALSILRSLLLEKMTCIDEKQKVHVEDAYEILEKYLKRSSYVAGEHLTIADVSCVTTLSALDLLVPMNEKYVNIRTWWNKLKTLDWYVTKNESGINDLRDLINFCLENNQLQT